MNGPPAAVAPPLVPVTATCLPNSDAAASETPGSPTPQPAAAERCRTRFSIVGPRP